MGLKGEDSSEDDEKHVDTAMIPFPFFEVRIRSKIFVIEDNKNDVCENEKTYSNQSTNNSFEAIIMAVDID